MDNNLNAIAPANRTAAEAKEYLDSIPVGHPHRGLAYDAWRAAVEREADENR